MPSLMATIGADATNFNETANRVKAKAKALGEDIKKSSVASAAPASTISNAAAMSPHARMAEASRAASRKKISEIRNQNSAALALAAEQENRARVSAANQRAAEASALAAKTAAIESHARKEKAIYGDLDRNIAKGNARKSLFNEMGFVPLGKLDVIEKKATKAGSAVGGMMKSIAAFASVSFISGKVQETIKYAEEVDELSKSLKVSRGDIQAFDLSAQKHGLDIGDIGTLMEKLNKNRMNVLAGNEPILAENFKAFGFTDEMLRTSNNKDLVMQVGRAYQDPNNSVEVLNAALGRIGEESAVKFSAAFQEGLAETIEKQRNSSRILSDETIIGLNETGDKWKGFFQDIKSGFAMMTDYALGKLTPLVDTTVSFVSDMASFAGAFSGSQGGISERLKAGNAAMHEGDAEMFKEMEKKAMRDLKASDEYQEKLNIDIINKNKVKEDDRRNKELQKITKAAKDKEEKEELAKKNRIISLSEKLADKQAALAMAGLTEDEKRNILLERRAELIEEIAGATDKERKLESELSLADVDKDLQSSETADNKPRLHSVNSLQQIGGFLGNFAAAIGPEVAAMNAQVKSEQHLADIKKLLARSQAGKGSAEVEY